MLTFTQQFLEEGMADAPPLHSFGRADWIAPGVPSRKINRFYHFDGVCDEAGSCCGCMGVDMHCRQNFRLDVCKFLLYKASLRHYDDYHAITVICRGYILTFGENLPLGTAAYGFPPQQAVISSDGQIIVSPLDC